MIYIVSFQHSKRSYVNRNPVTAIIM